MFASLALLVLAGAAPTPPDVPELVLVGVIHPDVEVSPTHEAEWLDAVGKGLTRAGFRVGRLQGTSDVRAPLASCLSTASCAPRALEAFPPSQRLLLIKVRKGEGKTGSRVWASVIGVTVSGGRPPFRSEEWLTTVADARGRLAHEAFGLGKPLASHLGRPYEAPPDWVFIGRASGAGGIAVAAGSVGLFLLSHLDYRALRAVPPTFPEAVSAMRAGKAKFVGALALAGGALALGTVAFVSFRNADLQPPVLAVPMTSFRVSVGPAGLLAEGTW